MDSLLTLVLQVGSSLFIPVKRELGCLCSYRKNIENLQIQAEKLENTKHELQHKVEAARLRFEETRDEVKDWIQKADEVPVIVCELHEKLNENKTRFIGWCPNLKSRYQLSKQAAKKLKLVNKLINERGNFNTVSFVPAPPNVIPQLIAYHEIEAAAHAIQQIMEALSDNSVRSIGIHGMGGIGKTTLMRRLNNELEGTQLFDKVIMVTVSQNPDLKRIQDAIAERLGLVLQPRNQIDIRANLLFKYLKEHKKILFILDDVWKELELAEIGIPNGVEHPGCKFILTTRIENVCSRMGVTEVIEMQCLSMKDSWNLFKSKAGKVVLQPKVQPIAEEIVRECQGSPLALVTIGSALTGQKDEVMWRVALRQLRRSEPSELDGIMPEVFSCIKLSYDYLQGEGTRLCFLFCSLFAENYNIPLSDLKAYGLAEGFLNMEGTMEDASEDLHCYVRKLKDSCLLLEGEEDGHVKMHDIVRDVARSISSKDYYGFVSKDGLGIEEWPRIEKPEECKRISLMYNEIKVLPEELKFPKLRTLLLQNNYFLEVIPASFFASTTELVNLDLSNTGIWELPLSIQHLANLRTLCLNSCYHLTAIYRLKALRKLEILRLRDSEIKELPDEIRELTNLRILDLTGNKYLGVPPNVIGQLSRLEELCMGNSFCYWGIDGREILGRKASFDEVAALPFLTALQLHIRNVELVSQYFSVAWRNLNSFCISVGDNYKPSKYRKSLSLHNLRSSVSSWVKFLLERTEELTLMNCDNYLCTPSMPANGFNNVQCLRIVGCQRLVQLIKLTGALLPVNTFGILAELHLKDMNNLEELFPGRLPLGFLKNLRVLSVKNCNKLGTLLPSAHELLPLLNLEKIQVDGCNEMKYLFRTGSTAEPSEQLNAFASLKELHLANMESLERICDGTLAAESLESLKTIKIFNCMKFCYCKLAALESVEVIDINGSYHRCFSHAGSRTAVLNSILRMNDLSLSRLRKLSLKDIEDMEKLFEGTAPPQFLLNLRYLELRDLRTEQLLFVVSANLLQRLECLEMLRVEGYSRLQQLFLSDGLEGNQALLPSLRQLHLDGLRKVERIWKGRSLPPGSLCYLQDVRVILCCNMRYLFSPVVAGCLKKLESLYVDRCAELEKVIGTTDEDQQIKSVKLLKASPAHDINFQNLTKIEIYRCDNLRSLFSVSVARGLEKLHRLAVWTCKNLETIFASGTEGEGEGKKVVALERDSFPLLKEIEIGFLPKLTNFFSCDGDVDKGSNSLLDWPSLERLTIANCPSLERLPLGPHSAPNLKGLLAQSEWFEGLRWELTNEEGESSSITKSRLRTIFKEWSG